MVLCRGLNTGHCGYYEYVLKGLASGRVYFIAVTAYDTLGNESDFSNEVYGPATDPVRTYTVTTEPLDLQVTVDGVSYRAPQNFIWNEGSWHTLSVLSPQDGSTGTRYVFSSWSDGGAITHTVQAPSFGTTWLASFGAEYTLTTFANPSGSGNVSPSGSNWYGEGQDAYVLATASSEYQFLNWSGDFSGSVNPARVIMDRPKSVTANFTRVEPAEKVSTPVTPAGVSSGTMGSPYAFITGGSSSSLGHPVEYQFDWKGDETDLSGWGAATQSKVWVLPGTYAVRARARCKSHPEAISVWSSAITVSVLPAGVTFTVTTSPSGLQMKVDETIHVSPKTFSWYPGSNHTLSIPSPQPGGAGIRHVFGSWSDGGTQSHSITAPSRTTTFSASLISQYSLLAPVRNSPLSTIRESSL